MHSMNTSDEYWYVIDGQRRGPVSLKHLKALFMGKVINLQTTVWALGFSAWTPISQTGNLVKLLNPSKLDPLIHDPEPKTVVSGKGSNRKAIDLSEYEEANRWR
jgi:GYF domain 2